MQNGASVLIERDGKVVARLVPAIDEINQSEWRTVINEKPRYLVKRELAFAPIKDVFDGD